MDEPELNYIKVWFLVMLKLKYRANNDNKMFNAGERLVLNNCGFGYLHHRIVFYLLNLHIKNRRTYFVRVRA